MNNSSARAEERVDEESADSLFRNMQSLARFLGKTGIGFESPKLVNVSFTDVNKCADGGIELTLSVKLKVMPTNQT